VGVSSRIVLSLYREFYGDTAVWNFDLEDCLGRLSSESDRERALSPEVQPFHEQIREEMADCQVSPAIYRSRLENARSHRENILALAGELLEELERAVSILEKISYPFSLSDYRIDPAQALVPIRYIRFLRNRYSTFNLIHEVGAERRMLELLNRRIGRFG
jgi:hypothetical protein